MGFFRPMGGLPIVQIVRDAKNYKSFSTSAYGSAPNRSSALTVRSLGRKKNKTKIHNGRTAKHLTVFFFFLFCFSQDVLFRTFFFFFTYFIQHKTPLRVLNQSSYRPGLDIVSLVLRSFSFFFHFPRASDLSDRSVERKKKIKQLLGKKKPLLVIRVFRDTHTHSFRTLHSNAHTINSSDRRCRNTLFTRYRAIFVLDGRRDRFKRLF